MNFPWIHIDDLLRDKSSYQSHFFLEWKKLEKRHIVFYIKSFLWNIILYVKKRKQKKN